MKTKYFKCTLQGELSAIDAQNALGNAEPQGLVVRIDTLAGETHIYIAAQGTSTTMSAKKLALPSGVKVEEVSELDVTKSI